MLNNFRERFLATQLQKDEKKIKIIFAILFLLVLLFFINLLYLNYLILHTQQTSRITKIITQTLPTTIIATPTPSLPVTQTTPMQSTQSQTNLVKDYFIPLGTGTDMSTDWADVPGVEAVVDFGQYANIKQIVFEASITVPTANEIVSVRLFNKTDQHPVWYSEVDMNGNETAFLTSAPLIYDTGSKLYQVQMKTQLQMPATLVQSRIHITTK